MHTLLIMAGLGDSSEGHWQNNWLSNFQTLKSNSK
jgi:predicted alpha/beta hydrolase family esterase